MLEVDFNAKRGLPEHFSASAITTYLGCQLRWYFRYVEGVKTPPGVAMVKGTSVHKVQEVNYGQKVESPEDLPMNDLLDVARDGHIQRGRPVVVGLLREVLRVLAHLRVGR